MAHVFICVGVALALSISAACAKDGRPSELTYETPGSIPMLSLASGKLPHRIVTISDHMLKPQTLTLLETERVAWFSYSRAPTRIRFEREVANYVICQGLVNFSIEEDELVSGELKPLDKASFCMFEPGRYRYQVVRNDRHNAARQRLDGVIVVMPVKGRGGDQDSGAEKMPNEVQGAISADKP